MTYTDEMQLAEADALAVKMGRRQGIVTDFWMKYDEDEYFGSCVDFLLSHDLGSDWKGMHEHCQMSGPTWIPR